MPGSHIRATSTKQCCSLTNFRLSYFHPCMGHLEVHEECYGYLEVQEANSEQDSKIVRILSRPLLVPFLVPAFLLSNLCPSFFHFLPFYFRKPPPRHRDGSFKCECDHDYAFFNLKVEKRRQKYRQIRRRRDGSFKCERDHDNAFLNLKVEKRTCPCSDTWGLKVFDKSNHPLALMVS